MNKLYFRFCYQIFGLAIISYGFFVIATQMNLRVAGALFLVVWGNNIGQTKWN